jgi:hypothetical protein
MKILPLFFAGYAAVFTGVLRAGCCEHHEAAEVFQMSAAIGEYRILSAETHATPAGTLATRYTAELNQGLKGEAPTEVAFETPGGRRGKIIEVSSLGLDLSAGDDCILHLRQDARGHWSPLPFRTLKNRGSVNERKALRAFIRNGARGKIPKPSDNRLLEGNSGVPGSRLTNTGYFESGTIPYRHIVCDSGSPIFCVVDIDPTKLPVGTDVDGALEIVQSALDAWSEVSSLKFQIEGTVTLGVAANTIISTDGKIRIQLHDNHGAIPEIEILGIGGSRISVPGHYAIEGSGGTLAGRTFLRLPQGHVVLNHRAPSMSDATNFAEVLTHEIGHALGLTHSSENPFETEPLLKDAAMYYSSHQDGRGADIREYDIDRIRFGYPLDTPPFSMDRVLRAVIASSGNPKPVNADPKGVGVDRITVSGGDLQGTPVTVSLRPETDPARFALDGNVIRYTSPGNYSDLINLSPEDIAAGNYYHQALFTLSDGTNQSAIHLFNITGFHRDSSPADGLPNSWLQTYFGVTTVGAVGSPHHPLSDPDNDGLDNRTERYLGTSPIDPNSGPAKLTFNPHSRTLTLDPVRFAPYAIEASSNLGTWTSRTAITTFSPPAPLTIPVEDDAGQPRMFYRARVTP